MDFEGQSYGFLLFYLSLTTCLFDIEQRMFLLISGLLRVVFVLISFGLNSDLQAT